VKNKTLNEQPSITSVNIPRTIVRRDKLLRAVSKALVRLPPGSEGETEFDVDTLINLTSAMRRMSTKPSQRDVNRMIKAAQSAVHGLLVARQLIRADNQTNEISLTLQKLLNAAQQLQLAWSGAFANKQVRNALNNRLLVGVIKQYGKSVNSQARLHEIMRTLTEADLFMKFGKRLDVDIQILLNAVTPMRSALAAAKKIPNEADHWCAYLLASSWAHIFGELPTLLHLDGKPHEQIFAPSPFHSFITALPLEGKIIEEAIRSAVESVQEIARRAQASEAATAER
jgi:hypothetical protein